MQTLSQWSLQFADKVSTRPFEPHPVLTINTDEVKQLERCHATRKVFSELNSLLSEVFGQEFTDAVAKDSEDETNS